MRHQVTKDGQGANIYWKEYQWGIDYRLYNIIDHTYKDRDVAFDYDDKGYLVRAIYAKKEEQFRTPDKLGNLYETKDKKDRKYKNSQLQQDQTYFYHYDVEGNLIFKEHIKDVGFRPFFSGSELRDLGINPKNTGKGFLYTWNANGSLRSVTDLKGVTYRFRYDAFGRRLEKRRMASTFRFVWDGNVLLHETFKKDNSENTELTTWVFEGFVPTAKLVNGKAYSIISDHLGTPILAVDSEGNEVWNRQLDIYGRVKREIKASSLGDDIRPFIPFLYQGQYYDFETKLAYNRFRYYSPESGMYISQDPIRLAGGNPTLYGYVKDSNWWVDVFGLDIIVIGEGQKRVNNTARNLRKDGNTVRTITDDWPKELFFNPYDPSKHEQISLEYNREWIKERMNEGYDIYDIGEDGRKSPFYEVEQEEIKKNKYNKHYEYNTETKEKSKVCHS